MEIEFWHNRWQRNEIGFHRTQLNVHLPAFWPRLDLAPGSQVFVPLCGKSLDLLWLAAAGHRVLGVEVSPIAVAALFQENGLAPRVRSEAGFESWRQDELEVLAGDFFALEPDRLSGVAAVYDRASLVALPPPMRVRYAAQLMRIVPPSAKVLLVTLEYDPEEMNGPPFAVGEDEVDALFSSRYRLTRLFTHEALAEEPGLRRKGLTRLQETVFLLSP